MRLKVDSFPARRFPARHARAAGFAGLLLSALTLSLPAVPALAAVDGALELALVQDAAPETAPAQAASTEAPAAPGLDRRVVSVGRGDTLMEVLTGASVSRGEAGDAIQALRGVFDPRTLKVGQRVTVLFEPRRGAPHRFVGLELSPDVARSVSVARTGESGFESAQVKKQIRRELVAAEGVIRSSLFEAGSTAGVPVSVLMALIQTYSYEVDFQRDLQPGDRFEVLYERKVTEDGEPAGEGDVLYANLVLGGDANPIYRHAGHGGRADYFNHDGESIRRSLLRTPIEGARLTSGFGMRMHPILGYSKMHKGVDFGAPTDTPIYAAGNGVVEEAGRHNGYGNYVRIRHNTEIATAYAHMSRFAKGIHRGMRVDQGEVIGYVGATGRATGAHLHYEVLKAGHQVNPKAIDLPTGEKLAGRELQAFRDTVRALERAWTSAKAGLQVARGTGQSGPDASGDDKSCSRSVC